MIFSLNRVSKILRKVEDLELEIHNYKAPGKTGFWKSVKSLQRISQEDFTQGPSWNSFLHSVGFLLIWVGGCF